MPVFQRGFSLLVLLALGVFPLACLPTTPEEEDGPATPDAAPAELVKAPAPAQKTDADASPEVLLAEWKKLAETPLRSQLDSRHIAIANELGSRGAEHLDPFFDVIAGAESTPEQKVFAVGSLSQAIAPAHAERLKTMVENSEDGTTRACATMLLGQLTDEASRAMLRELANDPESRVSMAASISLAEHGDAEMRARMVEHYWESETNARERARIVIMLMQNPGEEDFAVLNDALVREETDSYTRQSIAFLYGKVGDASVIPALEKSIEAFPEPSFTSMAQAAIASIKARGDSEGDEGESDPDV